MAGRSGKCDGRNVETLEFGMDFLRTARIVKQETLPTRFIGYNLRAYYVDLVDLFIRLHGRVDRQLSYLVFSNF